MHGLAVYVKEGLPFVQGISLENSADSYLCFQLVLLHSMINSFFLHQLPSLLLSTVFDNIEHIYMIPEVNSNQIEISLWGKISLQCKVTSLLAFTRVQVK